MNIYFNTLNQVIIFMTFFEIYEYSFRSLFMVIGPLINAASKLLPAATKVAAKGTKAAAKSGDDLA